MTENRTAQKQVRKLCNRNGSDRSNGLQGRGKVARGFLHPTLKMLCIGRMPGLYMGGS